MSSEMQCAPSRSECSCAFSATCENDSAEVSSASGLSAQRDCFAMLFMCLVLCILAVESLRRVSGAEEGDLVYNGLRFRNATLCNSQISHMRPLPSCAVPCACAYMPQSHVSLCFIGRELQCAAVVVERASRPRSRLSSCAASAPWYPRQACM